MGLNYLADVVFPICLFSELETKQQCFKEYLGTGFFIGTKGYFITAKHVVPQEKVEKIEKKDSFLILPRKQVGLKTEYDPVRITAFEAAPNDIDLVVGKTDYKPGGFFDIGEEGESYGWENVMSYGYPASIYREAESGKPIFDPSFLKGYITRKLQQGKTLGTIKNIPPGYALNYPIPQGMSGCPVFKDSENKTLVGVGVGTFEEKTQLWQNTAYKSDKEKYEETAYRVIETGFAINILSFHYWGLKIADGKTIQEISKE
jgi:hypothetical protein